MMGSNVITYRSIFFCQPLLLEEKKHIDTSKIFCILFIHFYILHCKDFCGGYNIFYPKNLIHSSWKLSLHLTAYCYIFSYFNFPFLVIYCPLFALYIQCKSFEMVIHVPGLNASSWINLLISVARRFHS